MFFSQEEASVAFLTAQHSGLMIRTSLNNIRNPWPIISPCVLVFYNDKSEAFRVYTIIIPFFSLYPRRRVEGAWLFDERILCGLSPLYLRNKVQI